MDSNITYEEAFKELKQIEADIQNETVSVDVLGRKDKKGFRTYCHLPGQTKKH